ncbi:MAG: cytidylyltransferase domain-containing protein [Aureispira sp.]
MTYNILEVANTHAGNIEYVYDLLREFEHFKEGFGIKFQPFHGDRIATKDFSWYPVYQKLLFSKTEWKAIITAAQKTKDIWIDVFDTYSVEIIEDNMEAIEGIKMQASVLYNLELLQALEQLELSQKKLIINISSYPIDEIREILARIKEQLQPQELILQIGFQAYPTKIEDSALSKIAVLRKEFPNYDISYTEHIDGTLAESTEVPALAAMLGATYIEKHIMHSQMPTEYDHYSSVMIEQYQQYLKRLELYDNLLDQPFINTAEQEYLEKSIQVPILKIDKSAGDCLSMSDLEFKRTNQTGLNVKQVQDLLKDFYVLRTDKKVGDVFQRQDFKKANIAVIVACRMKSSRLPKKAIKKIGDLASVEVCLKNALDIRNVNHVILATSTVEQDALLEDYTYHKDVIFHKGAPEDVIQRYLDIANPMKIDIIIRITADCPFLSDEITQINLKSHFQKGAAFTFSVNSSVGTDAQIVNTSALRKVKEHFPDAQYSEYMTYYFTNNPLHFRLNEVELPASLARDYRLTLDHQEDLDVFNNVDAYLKEQGLPYTIENVFQYLDAHPEVAAINESIPLVYKVDKELIERINQHTTILINE